MVPVTAAVNAEAGFPLTQLLEQQMADSQSGCQQHGDCSAEPAAEVAGELVACEVDPHRHDGYCGHDVDARLTFGSAEVHVSHALFYVKGLLYCSCCWAYTQGSKAFKLKAVCRRLTSLGKAQSHVKNRICRGLTPRAEVSWPLPDAVEAPASTRQRLAILQSQA